MGAPGSGKTVTLNCIAYGVATTCDWQVIVIDAKGDPDTQRQFASSMRHAGRVVHLFPQQGYDAWRGTGREITNRLVQLIVCRAGGYAESAFWGSRSRWSAGVVGVSGSA
jgi:ABC-type glutathione transport system ATPase component